MERAAIGPHYSDNSINGKTSSVGGRNTDRRCNSNRCTATA